MSGGALRIKLLDSGEEYEMPESDAFPAMLELEKSGTRFDATPSGGQRGEPQAEMTVGEPTIIKNNQFSYPPWDPGKDWKRDALNTPEATENSKRLDAILDDPWGIPKQLAATGANYLGGAIGLGGGGGGILANGARQAVAGGVSGAAQTYAQNPDADLTDVLLQGGKGALVGGLAGAGLSSLAKGFGGTANTLNAAADENRLLATGRGAGDVERMGPAARADLAGKIEASGMHEGPGMLGFLPQGIKQYARNGGAAMEAGQAGMSTAEDAITNLPGGQPSVPIRDIVRTQRDASARELGLADPAGEGSSAFRSKIASNLEADARNNPGAARGELPWSRALEQRRNFDSNASWGANPGAESAQNAIRKDVANDMRGAIDTSLNSPNVPPNLAQDWRGARDQYSLGSKVQEPALAALDAQSGRVPTSAAELPSMFARARGNAALSGAERGIASGFDAGAQGSAVAARGAGFVAGQQPENHEQNAAVTSWLGQKGVRVDTVTQQSRGNMLGPAAADLLKTEPQALGQWQGQFAQAANEGPEALNALIIKLESDPQFRAGPLARLQQMTGAQNGQ